jgi:hypothetical protein
MQTEIEVERKSIKMRRDDMTESDFDSSARDSMVTEQQNPF